MGLVVHTLYFVPTNYSSPPYQQALSVGLKLLPAKFRSQGVPSLLSLLMYNYCSLQIELFAPPEIIVISVFPVKEASYKDGVEVVFHCVPTVVKSLSCHFYYEDNLIFFSFQMH